MEREACGVCGGFVFYDNIGLSFCAGCNSQISHFVQTAAPEEVFTANLQLAKAVTVSKRKQKQLTKDTINAHSKWTTNEAFNVILKKLVDALLKLGANSDFEKAVFQLWTTFLRKTEFAFFKQIYLTQELKPKVPVLPRERDKQVMLENRELIEARKFRQNLLLTKNLKDKIFKKKKVKEVDRKKAKEDTSDKKKKVTRKNDKKKSKKKPITPQFVPSENEEDAKKSKAGETSGVKTKKLKRKRLYLNKYNSVSIKKVGVIGRMTMERVLDMLYLGLLLVHKRVLLCDLLGWIESSELPIRESSHLLPDNMKFQTLDNITFKIKGMPSHTSIRKNTAKLAKFLDVHDLPSKCLIEIVERFVISLNLPDEINQLVKNLIALDPPQFPTDSTDKKKVYPIPNYEGRALGFIIVVLKLLFGLDGKTEKKQSTYARKLSSLVPDHKFFVWEDWVNSTNTTSELIRRKNIYENINCLENFADVDQVVNYYLNTAKFHKGRLNDIRPLTYRYMSDEVRSAVKQSILSLNTRPEISPDLYEPDKPDTVIGLDWGSLSALTEGIVSSNVEKNNFHNATLNHITDLNWVQDLLQTSDFSLDIRESTAWTKSKAKSDDKTLIVYQPFHEYIFYHYWKDKRWSFNTAALNKLAPSLVWLIDVCASCGRLPSDSLYEEIMLIERIMVKTAPRAGETTAAAGRIFNINKSRTW